MPHDTPRPTMQLRPFPEQAPGFELRSMPKPANPSWIILDWMTAQRKTSYWKLFHSSLYDWLCLRFIIQPIAVPAATPAAKVTATASIGFRCKRFFVL
jgi:hypothetical protein